MTRFILIDNGTGYIFGDTADFAAGVEITDPIKACSSLDVTIGEYGRTYEAVSRLDSNETGYLVYRADVAGSEAVPVVFDGQDQATIDAVERNCEHVATIRCHSAE